MSAPKTKESRSKKRPRSFPLDPPGPEHTVLTVQEACVAELDGAVDLFIRFENIAAAHLLASAATELIRKRATKLRMAIENDILERAKSLNETTRQHIKYAIEYAYNNLKHSDGSDGVCTYFRREFVQFHLLMAVEMYRATFQDVTPKMAIFQTWALLNAADEHAGIRSILSSAGAINCSFTRADVVSALEHIDDQPAQANAAIKAAMSQQEASSPQPR